MLGCSSSTSRPPRSPTSNGHKLFAAIRRGAALGVGVLYVSHRLDEVFEIADTYTILRNGEVVASGAIADTTAGDVVTAMTGRSIDSVFPARRPPSGAPMLAVRDLGGRRIQRREPRGGPRRDRRRRRAGRIGAQRAAAHRRRCPVARDRERDVARRRAAPPASAGTGSAAVSSTSRRTGGKPG